MSNSFGLAAATNGAWAAAATPRDLLEQADVLRVAAELVVADQHAVGLAAEGAVLLLVDLLEQGALVELDGLLQVLEQLVLVTFSTRILSSVPVSVLITR